MVEAMWAWSAGAPMCKATTGWAFADGSSTIAAGLVEWLFHIVPGVKLVVKNMSHRRKFRGLTSDNMDSWRAELKSRVEQYSSHRKRESHSIRVMENKSTTAVKSQKIHVREMLGKSRIAVFFQWFVRSGVCKVGSLKRRVRRELLRRDRKHCTPLWREAHL